MFNIRKLKLNPLEKKSFVLHSLYSSIEGIVLGVLALNEFVFIKGMQGSNFQLAVLMQSATIVFIFLLFVNEYVKRIRDRKKLIRIAGIISRFPLILLFFFPRSISEFQVDSSYHYIFLLLFLIYYMGNVIIYPNINYLLKSNYTHQNFGTLYSMASSVNKIIMLIVTLVYGILLDNNNFVFVYAFPIIAILAIISVYVLTMIPMPMEKITELKNSVMKSVKESIKNMYLILKTNTPYRHFEAGFMLYGIAFMFTTPVLYIYFYEYLNLNYTSVAFYRNAYNIFAIFLLPFFGKLMGKIDPRKFGVITYISLGMYIFFLALTSFFPYYIDVLNIRIYYTLILYILFHGVFAATMTLLWNIGSAYFCKPEEAGTYQSSHLFLTGSRALFAPLMGVSLYKYLGFSTTFGISILLVMGSVSIMIWSYRREKSTNNKVLENN
jgi:MFS family permease